MNEPTTRYGLIRRRIRSLEQAHQFLRDLFDMGLLFHPEDSPDSVTDPFGAQLFTDDEAELLAQRIGEVYLHDTNPCAFCLTLVNPEPSEPEPEPEPELERKLELAIQQLSILCTNLEKGMSKSIQRLVARSTREVLVELNK